MGDAAAVDSTGTASCIAAITSPEGEQRFELKVGENVPVTDILQSLVI
jgi:hypothetical protein